MFHLKLLEINKLIINGQISSYISELTARVFKVIIKC